MQIRCAACGKVLTLGSVERLPGSCAHCGARPVPERLGDFVLDRPLAAGGMGEVYLAHHSELGTRVAIKLMSPPLGEDAAAMRERFAREARLQAAVDHPGVVRVLECDVFGDRPYLVLEFVSGKSLRELLADGPVPVAEAARLGAEVADVLAAAHACGVLHRDIKPENVLRSEDGRVRVLDFGIARARDGDNPVTRTGEIVGTPEYMAPEQVLDAGDEVDERADVHALGVLVYELLTGKNPFHGANVFAVLKLIESLVPQAPSVIREGVPAALDHAVLRALAKVREDRFESAAAFGAALHATVSPDAEAHPGERSARLGWAGAFAGAALLLFGFWLGDGFGFAAGDDRESADRDSRVAPTPTAFERGRARLMRGEFFAAIAEFEASRDVGAREWAQLAWLTAYRVLPRVVGAPADWALCDQKRRRRLFGSETAVEAGAAPEPAARLLAAGDAPAAWQQLAVETAATAASPNQVRATLAHMAVHLACDDPTVVRRVTARLPAGFAVVTDLLDLRLVDAAARMAALLERVRRLPVDGPEHWLLQLLAAPAAGADFERMRACAEMAWLHGAGESAVTWLSGQRVWQAQLAGRNLPPAERDRLLKLLAGCDPAEVPVADSLMVAVQGPVLAMPALEHRSAHLLVSPEHAAKLLSARGLASDSFAAMVVLARAGAEPQLEVLPWSRLRDEPMRTRWRKEVCGGVE
ncbi:MAG: serine/threonine protein kinase [bacterium]|nr:serine/threonine protein kinase [bacterium]